MTKLYIDLVMAALLFSVGYYLGGEQGVRDIFLGAIFFEVAMLKIKSRS